mmetsp:Transcript_1854/g.3594  ORF Transcript_1854/g.3594 Transcript_1854/m.3594 type:complete len:235 (+) Transcript_1854:527-1231(+)|eukprot:CAMPEP_0184519438 /NCGR_PEP_ID=MMETSP0198_2-20121128/6627_1 /TAXON_ID=1112570 /ORGANISM="Thraustochytrium sp., Strain LLF1b" /LENGTH=234 /DNA_ID=CAMNT_0026909955 /DNA_START=429 /DNA_END=1133 /DNA_ORIENTATION=-
MSDSESEIGQINGADFFPDVDEDTVYISLTVRTLSGVETHFPQIPLSMTVYEFKGYVQSQNKTFPIKQQKLIKGSKTLENNDLLGDYDLKDGDTIHLVKKLDDLSEDLDEAGPQVKISRNTSGQTNMLTVVVPENARPGTRLLINPPGRGQMMVLVPPGLRPGARFQVQIPPSGAPAPQTTPATSGGVMQVQCPPDARGGQHILIQVPGRGRMRVQVPRNVRPGENFRFRVPPA